LQNDFIRDTAQLPGEFDISPALDIRTFGMNYDKEVKHISQP
jgi:hypothetical protein